MRDSFASYIVKSKVKAVLMESNLRHEGIHTVTVDNVNGAYEMVSLLICMGHKQIAFIGGKEELCSVERLEEYKNAFLENNITFDKELLHVETASLPDNVLMESKIMVLDSCAKLKNGKHKRSSAQR